MEYGIQALAGIGMVFAVITDLWQKKIAVYVIFTITIVLLFMQSCSGNGFIWICSLGSGSIFYMISLLTKEKIGKGESVYYAAQPYPRAHYPQYAAVCLAADVRQPLAADV